MSKRLQILISDEELAQLKIAAKKERVPVGEWVRRAVRKVLGPSHATSVEAKLQAIQRAYACDFPTGDIDEINKDIAEGYTRGLP